MSRISRMTTDELTKMLESDKPTIRIVDVLSEESYRKEHIPDSINIPVDRLEQEARKQLKDEDLIVVYCASASCPASTNAAEKLLSLGFKHIFDYKGGLEDYKKANLPLEGESQSEQEVEVDVEIPSRY